MQQEAEETDCEVAEVVEELEVCEDLEERLGKRATVPHRTHHEHNGIERLQPVMQRYTPGRQTRNW